jgi:hypothetical protein
MSSLFSQMNFAIAAALAVMMLGRLWFGILFARPYAADKSHREPGRLARYSRAFLLSSPDTLSGP